MDLPALTPDAVISTFAKNTGTLFKRKSMKDFEYLDAEIDPPMWVNVTTALMVIFAYFGFWWYVAAQGTRQFTGGYGSGYNRFRNRY